MKFIKSSHRSGLASATLWLLANTLRLGLLTGASAAFAVAPPANTGIGNSASASFLDGAGALIQVTSNPVRTVVKQVGAFTVDDVTGNTATVVNSKAGQAGQTIYTPHILKNVGNGTDNFNISLVTTGRVTKVQIYLDDETGNPSGPALCTVEAPTATTSACATSVPITLASNGAYKFVVGYTLPAGGNPPSDTFDAGTLTVSPVTASASLYDIRTVSVKDVIRLTTGAVFNVSKTIKTPSISPAGSGTWPVATTGGPASSTSTCPTTWPVTATASCKYTVYTFSLTNTSSTSGLLALHDQLPAGVKYVTGSATWSNQSGSALSESGATVADNVMDYRYTAGTRTITAVARLNGNAAQTLSFVVLIDSTASIGTGTTTNTATYSSSDAPVGSTTSSTVTTQATHTSAAAYLVGGTYDIVLGSASSISATDARDTAGVPQSGATDTTTLPAALPGAVVKFRQKVYNLGSTDDIVNLVVSNSGADTFPTGTTFSLLGSDGFTALQDTDGDGVKDTGLIPRGGSAFVVVAANLPAGLSPTNRNYRAVLVGTSQGDASKKDSTANVLEGISRGFVDLTNTPSGVSTPGSADLGPGPSASPTVTNTTTPGVWTKFDLYVTNGEGVSRTYRLDAAGAPTFPSPLPPSWQVRFVNGAGGDCAAAEITQVTAPSSTPVAVTACVMPPSTQTPVVAVKVYFRVTSTTAAANGVNASDIVTDAVTVTPSATANYAANIIADSRGDVPPNGSVVYSHILTNVGLQKCGPYTYSVRFDSTAGWTANIYLDKDGDAHIGPGDTLVTGKITEDLLPGASHAQKFLVQINAPSSAAIGATSNATITATFDAPNSCGTPSVIDKTTVVVGGVKVTKSQARDANCDGTDTAAPSTAALEVKPGECILYHIEAVNNGITAVTGLTIHDIAPTYTVIPATQPTTKCSATGSSSGTPVYASTGAEVSCGHSTFTVAPGGKVTLDYRVKVNQ